MVVDDDGPGIAPADLPHVFDRLYTSRTVPGRVVGTGIGLAIVRELAVAMGGQHASRPSTPPVPASSSPCPPQIQPPRTPESY